MYFHVVIETKEKVGKTSKNQKYFELDKTALGEIEERVIAPFLRGDDFQFNGYFLSKKDILRIAIKETSRTAKELAQHANDNMPAGVFLFVAPKDIVAHDTHTKDITTEVFDRVRASSNMSAHGGPSKPASTETKTANRSKVFIVHGRDDLAKVSAARFVEKLDLSAIILHEQPSAGSTIIEKIEEHTNVGFAIVLYTPCDVGSLAGESLKPRARQNVVFEHGYLIAKLGRRNVCALVKGEVEIPNDFSGVVYVPLDDYGAWQVTVAKELRSAGYEVDMNKLV